MLAGGAAFVPYYPVVLAIVEVRGCGWQHMTHDTGHLIFFAMLLLSAHFKRFSVSRVRDFFFIYFASSAL